jgi:hypothetical protein
MASNPYTRFRGASGWRAGAINEKVNVWLEYIVVAEKQLK